MSGDCGCGGVCGGDCGCGGGCCAGISRATPASVANRPGLPELHYRVGTHAQFLASMQAALSSTDYPALSGLRTRASDDLTMGLLDGWAAVADVLTFYTERIAQEGYLATATERWSVAELARLVGYVPRPGLSATAYLSYAIAAGAQLTIPPGSKAQSVPGPGEQPATFETADPLVAHGEYSALAVRRVRPQYLAATALTSPSTLVVAGVHTEIRNGDAIVIAYSSGESAILEVTGSAIDNIASKTTLSVLVDPLSGVDASAPSSDLRARSERGTNPFADLVDALRLPPSVPPVSERELSRNANTLYGPKSAGVNQLLGLMVPRIAPTLGVALSHAVTSPDAAPKIARMNVRCALFGHQAPLYPRYRAGKVIGYVDPMITSLPSDSIPPPPPVVNVAAQSGDPFPISPPNYEPSKLLYLDSVYDGIAPHSQIILINPELTTPVAVRSVDEVTAVTVNTLGLSSRVSRVKLSASWPEDAAAAEGGLATILRGTTVLAQDVPLEPAPESMDAIDVAGAVIELDGVFPDLVAGRWVVVEGERTDDDIRVAQANDAQVGTGVHGVELSMIASVEHRVATAPDGTTDLPGDVIHTFIHLAEALAFTYLRSTVVLHGNVVRATHGETRQEVLGSGDATRPFAAYPLKQPPLTYLPAPTAAGAESTLQVYVDAVRWNETPDLVGAAPTDRSYTVRVDEQGVTSVVFGDGVHGARTPTGVQNIQATYRNGIGIGGNVGADRITLATSRPLGVTGVTNPVEATGGADPEARDAIRRNAAISIQALDRLVSVSDYEDFSSAFAGIGSASARELSDGRHQLVHVTIAGINDQPIADNSDLARNLRLALLALGDPYEDVRVAIRTLLLLQVTARVRISPDRRWSTVEPALRAAMAAKFGPSTRGIGQPIASSAVLATMAGVAGVDYIDLDLLRSVGEDELLNPFVPLIWKSANPVNKIVQAHLATADPTSPGGISPAELLYLSPDAHDTLILSEIT